MAWALVADLGCSGDSTGGSRDTRDVVVGIGEPILPAETLTDWVSYAARVVQLTVVAEREIPPPQSVLENREGYIGRTVSVPVERTFWTSPGAVTPGADPNAGEFDIVVSGWVLRGDRRVTFVLLNSPRIEVGGKYVMPLITLLRPALNPQPSNAGQEQQEVQWGPLSGESVFEVQGNQVAQDDVHRYGNSEIARSLSLLPPADLERTLAEAPPDPIAAKYWHLPPYERWLAVSAEK
jgi:hypothetical protein